MVGFTTIIYPALAQVGFDRIIPRDILKFLKRNEIKELLIEKIIMLLLSANDILSDAEKKQISDPFVKQWVIALQQAVYDADDLHDQITAQALEDQFTENFHPLDMFGLKTNADLELMNSRLSTLIEHKDFFGFKEDDGAKLYSLSMPTNSVTDSLQVDVRHGKKEEIARSLSNHHGVSVVVIVGMAGIGKTTLSQLLFKDNVVESFFDFSYWVSVSKESDIFSVTNKIFESVTGSSSNTKEFNELQKNLRTNLEQKKFLLVLDDCWGRNLVDWNILKRPLASGHDGSVIVVTTRDENLALSIRADVTHNLPHLSDDDCWKIFADHAFGAQINPDMNPTLTEVGQKIAKKCKGHPLAAKTLGSLSHLKVDVKEWDDILESNIWDLPTDKISMLPAVRLSYQHLPYHLKRCFAYLSLFPKGFAIDKWNLIFLWIAEGLLPPSRKGKTVEKVGEEYIKELLSRSFLQQSSSVDPCFVMHDLINELAQHAGGELFHRLEGGDPKDIAENVRHLSFFKKNIDAPHKFTRFRHLSKLRTFLPLVPRGQLQIGRPSSLTTAASAPIFSLLRDLSCLRVLSLSHYPIEDIPSSIMNLKHLRYLNLSNTPIKEVPIYVASLYNLQTLLLTNCNNLNALPDKLTILTYLRHLDIKGTRLTEMPPNLKQLKFLQVLTDFFVSENNGSRISELGELSQLRGALSLVRLEYVSAADALRAKLKEKKFLEELELKWETSVHNSPADEKAVLCNLEPHKYLKRLNISNYGGRSFPNWLENSSFSNMVSVYLRGCPSLESFSLSSLPAVLKSLDIRVCRILKLDLPQHGTVHCRALEQFHLESSCDTLKSFPLFSFPALRRLHIQDCPNLEALEVSAGVQPHHHCLERVVLQDCPELASVSDGAFPTPNLQSLLINNCVKLSHRDEWCLQTIASLVEVIINGTRIR